MRKYINVCYVTLSGGNKIIVADFSEGSKNPRGKYFDLTVTASEGGVVTSPTVISIAVPEILFARIITGRT